jgi:cell division protease FtsH
MDTNIIVKKKRRLERAKKRLKKKFVGIDCAIDEFFQAVEGWYLLPEVLTRPTIVNIWGITGVGKTALVEEFVRELKLIDRFSKLELGKTGTRSSSVLEMFLSSSNVKSGEQNIIFFDEIQNFRTREHGTGKEITEQDYTDFWELLNTGHLNLFTEIRDYLESFSSSLSYKDEKLVKDTWYGRHSEELEKLKTMMKLEETPKEIANWPIYKMCQVLRKHSNKVITKLDCTKSLIIVAGNIDEAYRFSALVNEIDIDADEFYKKSKDINFLHVKKALLEKFRPEQIARLGNIHITYPCLNKKAYLKLIDMKLSESIDSVKEKTGLTVELDDSVTQLIYNNGVFPAQGARPVFTSIREMFENHIPKMVLHAMDTNSRKVTISYADSELTVKPPRKEALHIPCEGKVSSLKLAYTDDELASTAVHEAGHAIVFAALYNAAPLALNINSVSGDKLGYTILPKVFMTANDAESDAAIALAGMLAEKLIFGKENVSAGSEEDIRDATRTLCLAVRVFGMHAEIPARIRSEGMAEVEEAITDIDATNQEVLRLLSKSKDVTEKILEDHKELLIEVATRLRDVGQLKDTEFIDICAEYGLDSLQRIEKLIPAYNDLLKKAKESL